MSIFKSSRKVFRAHRQGIRIGGIRENGAEEKPEDPKKPGNPGKPDYNMYTLNAREKRRYFFASIISLFLIGILFYKNLILSACLAFLSIPLRRRWQSHLAEKRRDALTAQFRDLLYALSASVSAGRQLQEAFEDAREQLEVSYGPDSLIYREVDGMVRGMRESRQPPEELLRDFALRSHIPEVSQFVRICCICRRSGGDMERIIGKTSTLLMEKIAVRQEIRMVTAQKRLEANILTLMPVGMVMTLNLLSPDYLAVLYDGMAGRAVMTAALSGIALSYHISRKITEISV